MFCSFERLSFLFLVSGVTTSSTAGGTGVSIKRCCSPGFGLLNRTCVPYRQVDLTVAVKLPKVKNISHVTIQEHETWDRKCGEDDHKIRQVTVNSHLNFIHVDGTTFFPWTTPEGNEWLVDTFCMEALFEPPGRKQPVFAVEFCHDLVAIKAKDEEIKCQHRTCIRKCCPKGMVFDENCSLRDDILWNPKFFSTKDPNTRVRNPRDLLILYGFPQCKVRLHYENYRVLENGWLHTMDNFLQTIPPNQYCLDLHTHFDGVMKEEVFACYEERDRYCRTRHVVVDLVFMIISCIFLAASLLIYVCFRSPRSSNLDRCVVAFLAALLVAFTSVIINRQQQDATQGAFCSFIGTVNHIGILATYFWLTLLCCHVWFCIRSGRVRDETHLFAAYSLCGWGVPLIVALTGAHLPSDDPYQLNRPRADFLPADCWFKDSALRWGYQYGFMLALFLLDFVLFCCSVVALKRKKQELQYMREEVEGTFLNSKLLLILFVVWAMELIPWWLEANGCNIWVSIVDGLGALCGVYIFFAMFCCSCNAAKIPKARSENTEENPDSPAIELFESPTASAPPENHYGTADRNGITPENGRS